MNVKVLWIVLIIKLVESSQNAKVCNSLDYINWSIHLDYNKPEEDFKDEYTWKSWVSNIAGFKWIWGAKSDKSTRNICACVLLRTIARERFSWDDVEKFYTDMKNALQMEKKNVKVRINKTLVQTFPATECSFNGVKLNFVRGYRKKSIVAPIFNIYIERVNPIAANDEFIRFDGYLRKVNPNYL